MNDKEIQRWSAVAAGAMLAAAGAKRGGRDGLLLTLGGGALAVLAALKLGSRHQNIFAAGRDSLWEMPRDRLVADAKGLSNVGRQGKDVVHEASEESFPASDAPSYGPTTSIGGHDAP